MSWFMYCGAVSWSTVSLSRKSYREQKIIEKNRYLVTGNPIFISVLLNFEFLIKVFSDVYFSNKTTSR